MAYSIPPPSPMVCAGNLETNWTAFKEAWLDYRIAVGLDQKEQAVQVATLKTIMGMECRKRLKSLTLTDAESKSHDSIIKKLDEHFKPARNVLYDRHKFFLSSQQQEETVDQYYMRLTQLAEYCKFGDIEQEMIRDKLVIGCTDAAAKARLFRLKESDATLKTALESLRISEATNSQLKSMSGKQQSLVADTETVNTKRYNPRQAQYQHNRETSAGPNRECGNCGLVHKSKQCPAFGQTCNNCGKRNHWRKKCRSKPSVNRAANKQAHEIYANAGDVDSDNPDSYGFDLETIETVNQHNTEGVKYAVARVKTQQHKSLRLKAKVDTGAKANILNFDTYRALFGPQHTLKPSPVRLSGYGNKPITNLGSATAISVQHGKKRADSVSFYVTESGNNLFGLDLCKELGIVRFTCDERQQCCASYDIHEACMHGRKEDIIKENEDVFTGIGKIASEYHIELTSNAEPVVKPARRTPDALKQPLREELDRLLDLGILREVREPTDWVNDIVLVTKPNGSLRLCLDPRELNKFIKRPHYYAKTLDDILPELRNTKIFSTLDLRSGYWNIPLDTSSQTLTTFSTIYGRFCFTRLPFGLISSQDIFQQDLDGILGGIANVFCIKDDILIAAETQEQHDIALQKVFQACRQNNIRLNSDKCYFNQVKVKLFGHILSADGIAPDPAKVSAIRNLKAPSTKQELQSLLGLVQYLAKFAKMSQLTEPLRKLLQNDAAFVWTENHDAALDKIKYTITKAPVLAYFDASKPIEIQCDASMKGLGAVLVQDGRPVHFASKALTRAEANYSNIERETLAAVWATNYFKYYVFGRKFIICSDHKPLEDIAKKDISKMPSRLQRLMLQLQGYNYAIKYVSAQNVPMADCLSRCIATDREPKPIPHIDVHVHEITNMKPSLSTESGQPLHLTVTCNL
ncbi:hypothetical protein BSL78_04060 [Apostichopus japonicus]|uniref:Reverse transcriptase domain-containing protein n=1 Tax=Stichopus japonicus TaxID=307972 RepID=A0A2G8LFK5_STIJA|nr:hypothetical protein BSL78_04060 [Apostichopus japonicus]